MSATVLTIHEGLDGSRRWPSAVPADRAISTLEIAMLVGFGVIAALLSAFVRTGLGVPGHNIIRVIFPMAMGLALVPRRGAGSVMGLSGLATGALLSLAGTRGMGSGALTGLVLTGLLIDVALRGAATGRSVYWRLALAGVGANLVALLVRAETKLAGLDALHAVTWDAWWSKAMVTYAVCGLLAGLFSAAVWFRFGAPAQPGAQDGASS